MTHEPRARRPYMPGYGIEPASGGRGLLPWSWAVERLTASHDYWVATRWPDGRPHVMPVWAMWHDGALWFSSSRQSRKAKNLDADARVSIATDNAREPVVVDGMAERVTEKDAIATLVGAMNAKYGTDYSIDFLDPAVNALFRVRPETVFSLTEDDFTGSPTRWDFE